MPQHLRLRFIPMIYLIIIFCDGFGDQGSVRAVVLWSVRLLGDCDGCQCVFGMAVGLPSVFRRWLIGLSSSFVSLLPIFMNKPFSCLGLQ